MNDKYYIINKNVLPEVFEKVINVKKLLYSGEYKTVNDAVNAVGLSRSAYYKYKDDVSVYDEKNDGQILSLNLILSDRKGVLSALLSLLSKHGASILTINQNIPFDDIAPVSVSLTTGELNCPVEALIADIGDMDGIIKVDVVAKK